MRILLSAPHAKDPDVDSGKPLFQKSGEDRRIRTGGYRLDRGVAAIQFRREVDIRIPQEIRMGYENRPISKI